MTDWDKIDRQNERFMKLIAVAAVCWVIMISVAIGAGVYLAIKNWG